MTVTLDHTELREVVDSFIFFRPTSFKRFATTHFDLCAFLEKQGHVQNHKNQQVTGLFLKVYSATSEYTYRHADAKVHGPLGMSLTGAEPWRPNGAVGTVTVCRPSLACTAAAHGPGTRASWWLMAMVSGSWHYPKIGPSSLALTWQWLPSGSKLKFSPLPSHKVKAGP